MYRRAADFKKQRERRDGAWIRDREADMIKKDPHFSLFPSLSLLGLLLWFFPFASLLWTETTGTVVLWRAFLLRVNILTE